MKYQLINGDCLDLMKNIQSNSVDMILCDIPYGTTQNKWDIIIPLDLLWEQYERIIKKSGMICLFSAEPFTSILISSNLKMFKYDLIWEKSHAVGFLNARRMPMRKHENICCFYKKLPKYFPILEDKPKENIRPITTKNRLTTNYGNFDEGDHRTIPVDKTYPKSILKFNNESKTSTFHPTQKPIKLLEYLIRTYTEELDLVLDNCAGSFSTGIACINTNRNFIGIEKDLEYFSKGKKWIDDEYSKKISPKIDDFI